MKFFVDECLSPSLVDLLGSSGHEAVHPLHIGRRGDQDHVVLRRCLEEDRVIITANADDFRGLVGNTELHPGLIVMPDVGRNRSVEIMRKVLEHIDQKTNPGDPVDYMINRVIESDKNGNIRDYALPAL